jgi:hypothetical protein
VLWCSRPRDYWTGWGVVQAFRESGLLAFLAVLSVLRVCAGYVYLAISVIECPNSLLSALYEEEREP